MITPVFESLSSKYSGILAVKVDVDANQEVARDHGVSAMPTFKVFLQGREINELKGADKNGLENLFKESIEFYVQAQKKQAERTAPVTNSEEELLAMSIKELKAMITDRGKSFVGLSEKIDLVKRLRGEL